MTTPLRTLSKAATGALLAISMAACSGGSLMGLRSNEPPTYSEIVQEYRSFREQWDAALRTNAPITEPALALHYVAHGYDLADRACLQYFTKLREIRNQTTFVSNTLSALFAAGGVIAGLSGVASPILVGLFAAGGLVPSTVESFNNVYLLAQVADDLYPKAAEAMAKYRLEHPADNVATTSFNRFNARERVQEYATLCSLPFMTAAINHGISNLQLTPENSGVISVTRKPPTR